MSMMDTSTIDLAALAAPDDTSGFDSSSLDLSTLDSKIGSTFEVDAGWDAPELPDEVRYDLATSPLFQDPMSIKGFLFGLRDDLNQATRDGLLTDEDLMNQILEPSPESLAALADSGSILSSMQAGQTTGADPATFGQMFLPEESTFNTIRRVTAGVAGKQAPEALSLNAANDWKREALKRGLITPEQANTERWSPGLFKSVNYEMMSQQLGETISGNRDGAVSTPQMLDLFDKWLSPSGLLSAAMALDFIPDPEAIQSEFQTWGDKWRRWNQNRTSIRDFIDATTGPIDDVVFPIVNTALLFSGVGSTWQMARFGVTGVRAAQAAEATGVAARLLGGGKAANALTRAFGFGAFDAAATSSLMGEASFLSSRLAKSGYRSAVSTANAMNKWRSFHQVQTVKQGVRAGMKLGIAGNVENLLLPDRAGGYGLFGQGSGSADVLERARSFRSQNPTAIGVISVADLAFQPTRIFEPGRFTQPFRMARTAASRFSETLDPALDVTNRWEYVTGGAPAEVYERAARLARDRDITRVFVAHHDRYLDDESRLLWNNLSPEDRSLAAVNGFRTREQLERFADLTPAERAALEERAGKIAAFVVASSAIQQYAERSAAGVGAAANKGVIKTFRNQAIHQIRPTRANVLSPQMIEVSPGVYEEMGFLDDLDDLLVRQFDASIPTAERLAARDRVNFIIDELRTYAKERLGFEWADDVTDFDEYAKYSKAARRRNKPLKDKMDAEVDETLGDPGLTGKETATAWRLEREKKIDAIVQRFIDPSTRDDALRQLREHIPEHDARRQGSLNWLMDGLDIDQLAGYLDDIELDDLNTWDNWDAFMDANNLVQGSGALYGEADGPVLFRLLPDEARGALGNAGVPGDVRQGTDVWQNLPAALREINLPEGTVRKSVINFYKGQVSPGEPALAGLTVARLDTPVKQDIDNLLSLARQVRKMREYMNLAGAPTVARAKEIRGAVENWRLGGPEVNLPGGTVMRTPIPNVEARFADFSDSSIAQFIASDGFKALDLGLDKKTSKRLLRMMRWVEASGGDMDDVTRWMDNLEDTFFDSSIAEKYGITRRYGLNGLIDTLGRERQFVASAVGAQMGLAETNRKFAQSQQLLELEGVLAEQGYRLVYGVNFLHVNDLMGMSGPFAALRKHDLNMASLGTFASKTDEVTKTGLRRRNLRQLLPERLAKITPSWGEWRQQDFDDIVDKLEEAVWNQRQLYEETVDETSGIIQKTFRRVGQARSPRTIWDQTMTEERIAEILSVDRQTAMAIKKALVESRTLGFEFNGLLDLENRLVSQPIFRRALGMFDASGAADEAAKRSLFKQIYVGDSRVRTGTADFRTARQATGAALAAAFGYAGTERLNSQYGADMNPLVGAAAGLGVAAGVPVFARAGSKLAGDTALARGLAKGIEWSPGSSRTIARAAAAGVGATVGNELAPADDEGYGAIAGAFIGATATPGLFRAAGKAYDVVQSPLFRATGGRMGMREYSRLSEWGLGARDFLRFTINPWFDAQRYSEAYVMNATKQVPDGFHIPLNSSPTATMRRVANGKIDTKVLSDAIGEPLGRNPKTVEKVMGGKLRDLTNGRIDPDLMESSTRRFTDQGILGFSNHRWQTAAFTHLVSQGMSPQRAADTVVDLYSYGREGRSAAELSANFIFFPFSYMKKFSKQVGGFLLDDLSRAIVLHDGLKSYEYLSERYDLQDRLEAYMPVLRELRTLNPLAFGLSPGQLGGINRPLLEVGYNAPVVGDAARSVLNLFIPQAVQLEKPEDAAKLEDVMFRAIPAVRSMQRLITESLPEQGNVLFSQHRMSRKAEIREGERLREEARAELEAQAAEMGATANQVMRSTPKSFRRYSLRQQFKNREAQIMSQYPALGREMAERVAARVEKQQELSAIVDRSSPAGLSDRETAIWTFAKAAKQFEESQKRKGLNPDEDSDFYDEGDLRRLRALAIGIAAANPGFDKHYQQYYEAEFGPIAKELR